jgi:uncharacterized protein YcbK (DUF882 family)
MWSPIKVRALFAAWLLSSGCATRAVHPLAPERELSGGVGTVPLLSIAAGPTLSALVSVEHAERAEQELSPRRALAYTQGGVSFEALSSVDVPQSLGPDSVRVHMRSVNSSDEYELDVTHDGAVDGSHTALLEAFLSCRRTGRSHAMAAGVLRVLAAITQEFPGHTIEIISGFRASPFGVKESKHFDGRAIDLRVKGVKLTKVRDFVWRNFTDVGVGYYGPQNFIHVDFRPDEKDTAWSSAHEDAVYEYNPRWALRIRPPWREPMNFVENEAEHEHSHEHELALQQQPAEQAAL